MTPAGIHGTLPGLSPSLASVALGRLMTQWLELMKAVPEGQTSTQETDRLVLAAVLLAHENASLVRGTCWAELSECLELARSGSWAHLDEICWLLVKGFVTTGVADARATRRLEQMLNHHDSSVRTWFHYVAWMIHGDLDVETVRPILLQNLADKLGAVKLSAGLLAVLHPDKSLLDKEADAFEPAEFEDQYRTRLQQIRELEWNANAFNFWLAENTSRQLIWDAVKNLEVS